MSSEVVFFEFKQLPFSHPLYIMYSSGTKGKPKSIVHSSGGTLLQHLKELIINTDLSSNDLKNALNANLSNNIFIKSCEEVNLDFHSSLSSIKRYYF